MADTSATIIAASLSSEELEKSIDKLVGNVATATDLIRKDFDDMANHIKQSLNSLGNIKIDFGGTADGGSSRRTSKQKEEESQIKATTQAYKEQAATFDQQAASVKRASRGSTLGLKKELDETSNSYSNLIQQLQRTITHFDVSPIQSLRMRQHELEAGMRTASNEAAKAKKDVDELNAAITNYRSTLETLPKNGQGFSNRQAIQKEINDLIVLRDTASAEQQKWENAGRQLASQYEIVKSEIRQIGQALISAEESEKHVTTELDKQLQKINEISSRKTATQAFRDAISMETDKLEKAESKLAVLQALKTKILNTDLLSKKDTESLTSYITYTTALVERMRNKTAKSTKDDEDAIRRAAEAEKKWAENIVYRGQVAQETSRKLIRMLNEEAQAGGKGLMGMFKIDGKDVNAVRELEKAIKDMQMQYNQMSDMDKDSAIGRALKRDIENAKVAAGVISGYNKAASGLVSRTSDTESFKIRNYETLKNVLKELTNQYNQVSIAEIKAGNANHIIDAIQRTSREAQQLQSIMNRPTSFASAMKLPEKTLDDLSYKIRQLQNYKLGIDLQNPNAANEIKQVDEAILKLQKDLDKYLSKSKDVLNSNNALGRSWNYMKNRLAFYFTVGASTQFIKNLIEVRSQYEMNERALGILINSAERGTQIFNELSQMALVSPYTLIELSNAAKQLTAYDIAAKDVVDTTRRLADMASAVGVPMERLTYALGQIKAYGYLNSRDARMFANAGIPLVRELSKYYSELEGKVVSVGDVYDRMKKKAIDFNSVMSVVTKMTDEGGKFFDFQAKMADTLKVRLANLTLAWNNMLNDIGKETQGVLVSGIGVLRDLFLHWQDIYGAIQRVVLAVGLWKGAQALALLAIGELNTKMGMQVLLGEKLQTRLSGLAGSTKNLVSGYAAAGAALLFVVSDAIMTYQRNAEEIAKLNKVIVDGAKESANSIYEFIESAEMSYARLSARTGNLPKPDAEKTWDALREQIELSAISAKDIIPELIKIEDLNERVTKAFNLAERIAEANNKLIDLDGKLDVSQNSVLFGLFGEGLAEDIDDFNERLRISAQTEELLFKSTGSVITDVIQGLTGFFNDMKEKLGSSTEEAEREIKNFAHNAADAIKDELGEEGLKDSIQVNEAVSRVLKGIEQQFPQIKGQGKALFESIYNDIMAKEFNGAVDKQAYYYKLFLERLKKDHGSAFQGVTEDIDRETFKWSDAQMKAIKKTADRIKEDIPEAYQDSVTEILNDLNSREFKMRIVAEFATTSIDDINKAFRKRFIEAGVESVKEQVDEAQNGINKIKGLSPWGGNDEERKRVTQQETENLQKYGFLMKKANESDLDYQERISKERQKSLDISAAESKIIAANTGKEEEGAQVVLASAIEQKKAADERLKAISDVAEWGGYDFSTKKENAAATKAQHAAETELQKALKDELKLIETVRSSYKDLTKEGASHADAIEKSVSGYEKSVANINAVLNKYGIGLDLSKFAGISNPHELQKMLQDQLNALLGKAKPAEIQALEVELKKVDLDVEKYDLTKITKGLNNELDRLKEEYELAIALDADPELGSMFADWMGIDMDDLPRTASEYAKRYTDILNKKLKEYNANTDLPNLLNITDDDLRELQNRVGTGGITQKYVDDITNGVKAVREVFRKEKEDTSRDWNALIEKYGGLQAKLLKIYKDNVQQQASIVREFGTNDEQTKALDLISKIKISQDPAEIARLQEELAKVMNDVTSRNPVALKTYQAVRNEQESQTGKAYWEDFKDSDLYSMTFTDMANNSTQAIQMIINKLNELKNKVKEDPASMKALIKSLEDAEGELMSRDPFAGIVNSIRNWNEALKEKRDAEKELKQANIEVAGSEVALKNAQSVGDKEAIVKAEQKLAQAQQKQANAQAKVVLSGNKAKKAQEQLKNSLQNLSNELGNVSGLLGSVSQIFRAVGDDDTADAIDAINQGFTIMTTVISAVTAALIILQSSNPWLLAMAAALSVIVGLVSFLSGNSNKRITEQVEESENAVKRLEVAYVDLQQAIDKAYGTATIGAKQAALANKELQLAEIQRQIQLEKSRTGKNRDEGKIIDLQKQYKELFYEIKNGYTEIVDDLMGTDVASFAENLVSSMIDAFKQGEDYMKVFSDKFDEMIDNMIMKSIVSRVVSQSLDKVWRDLNKRINERTKDESNELAKLQERATEVRNMSDEEIKKTLAIEQGAKWYGFSGVDTRGVTQEMIDEYRKAAQDEYDAAQKRLDAASAFTDSDIDYVMGRVTEIMPELGEKLQNILGQYYKFGESSETQLSALQQGISQISEQTANALEGYMNGVSQQVYYQSDLMTQIRDAVVGFSLDVQVATMSQILLQLRSSYEVQSAIHSVLEGWSSPNGMSVRVEMV